MGPVTRPDGDAGVHTFAAALAHALRLARTGRINSAQQRLARSIARESIASGGRTTERRERELLAVRLLGVALAGAVDRAAMAREDLLHALRGPRCDVGDLFRARRGERVKHQRPAVWLADVDAVEQEDVALLMIHLR